MDVGITRFETEARRVTLLDAPGHRDFIPKMIAGAAQADVAILVVSAIESEFAAGFNKGGQTKEHAMLVRSLGVKQLIVAVNKMDSAGWSMERFDAIKGPVARYLAEIGFQSAHVRFIPVSGLEGGNINSTSARPSALTAWFKGPSLSQGIGTLCLHTFATMAAVVAPLSPILMHTHHHDCCVRHHRSLSAWGAPR